MTTLTVSTESWPIRGSFTISRGSKTTAEVVVVTLSRSGTPGGPVGRGEAVPYARYGESMQSVLGPIESLQGRSEEHTSELPSLMRISYAVFSLKKTHNN